MKRGLVIGKFYPFTKGHEFLIQYALEQVDELWIIVCQKTNYKLSPVLRASWIESRFRTAKIVIVHCDHLADDDSEGWAHFTTHVMGGPPDVVFTSEDYGEPYAKFMGSVHVMVDRERKVVPISATIVRRDIMAASSYLPPVVNGNFVSRVVLVGAESTGKTTMAEALANQYETTWVPEYGRTYCLGRNNDLSWTSPEFLKIARIQNQMEDDLAERADTVLFCDTNALATAIWHERYVHTWSRELEEMGRARPCDLYVILDVSGVPFVQDGTRDGEHIREWMQERFIECLTAWNLPFVVLSGEREDRLRQATQLVNALLKEKKTLPI